MELQISADVQKAVEKLTIGVSQNPKDCGQKSSDEERKHRAWNAVVCAGFPCRHEKTCWHHTFNNAILETARFAAKSFPEGVLIALLGKRGTGKTEASIRITYAIGQDYDIQAKYLKAMEFFLALKDSYKGESAEGAVLNKFFRPELLILDELQERSESEWENRMLTHLIDKRYDAMKSTILISNLTHADFKKSVGSSIYDRLIETGMVVECMWQSYRQPKETPCQK